MFGTKRDKIMGEIVYSWIKQALEQSEIWEMELPKPEVTAQVKDLAKQVEDLQDTSIKVGDKVMLKKDMTKVYEVESIREGDFHGDSPYGTPFRLAILLERELEQTKYSLDNNKVYTQDQILPYREDSHLLAKEIKKLK